VRRKHPVTQVLGDHTAKGFDLFGTAGVERSDDVALLFGIKAR
jgi:hypothetical protein